jgi:hypothetical protein
MGTAAVDQRREAGHATPSRDIVLHQLDDEALRAAGLEDLLVVPCSAGRKVVGSARHGWSGIPYQ